MKISFVRGAFALATIAAFNVAGAASTPFGAGEPIAAGSETELRIDDPSLRQALAFDRHAELTAAPTLLAATPRPDEHARRCRFTSSKNALRPRKNECRLA